MSAPAEHVGEARERARGDAVERAGDVLDTAFGDAHVLELEPPHSLAQEPRLLPVRIDEQRFRAAGAAIASGIPGKPAPLPRSASVAPETCGRIASESSRCRVTISAGSRTAVRLYAAFQRSSSST